MENNKKDRTQLKSYFKSNAVPTEQNFKDFIDANLNQKEDGVAKIPNGALAIQSATGSEELLHFYKSFDDANPTWRISQKPSDRPGFTISDGAGANRLFIDSANGNTGISVASPQAKLDVGSNDGSGILIRSGNGASDAAKSQLTFGWNGSAQFRHALKTRHNGGGASGNAIDFYLWKVADGQDNVGTQHVMTLDGNANVGIGITSPTAKLQVMASGVNNPAANGVYVYNKEAAQDAILAAAVNGTTGGNPFLSLGTSAAEGWSIGLDNKDSQSLKFASTANNVATSTRMTLTKAGNLGIGVTPSAAKLDVLANDANGILIRSGNEASAQNKTQIAFGYSSTPQYRHSIRTRHHSTDAAWNGIDFYAWKPTDGLDTLGSQFVMTAAGSGNVGIGVMNPTAKLDVVANDATGVLIRSGNGAAETAKSQLTLGYNGTAQFRHAIKSRHHGTDATWNGIDFYAWKPADGVDGLASQFVMTAAGSGNVGIGVMNPSAKLHIITSGKTNPAANGLYCMNSTTGEDSIACVRTGAAGNSAFVSFDIETLGGWSMGVDNADARKFKIASTWNSITNTTRMTIDRGNGFVGIGVTAPKYPLQVAGSAAVSTPKSGMTNGAKMDIDKYDNQWDADKSADISIMAEHAVASRTYFVCHESFTFSDARIKNIVGRSNAQEDLATLMRLQVTDYRHIDKRINGHAISKKVIAQEVEEVYPLAVKRGVETLPDIYARPVGTSFDAVAKELTFEMEKAIDLKADDLVDIVSSDENGRQTFSVVRATANTFTIATDNELENPFVYGKQVDDFRSVDYDALFMLGISSIQALNQEVNTLKEEVAVLKTALTTYSA